MTTLKDRLNDLAQASVEAYSTAYSKFKDVDDAEMFLEDLLAKAVWETMTDIRNDRERYFDNE